VNLHAKSDLSRSFSSKNRLGCKFELNEFGALYVLELLLSNRELCHSTSKLIG